MRKRTDKKAQVTIFIIIAIAVVVFGVLIYMLYPKIQSSFGFEEKNPYQIIQDCLEEKITESVDILASQGGSIEPELYYLYNNTKIEYLCYTDQYYLTCVMQQPMLKVHIEDEIKNNIKEDADKCFSSLDESYEKQGYKSELKKGEMNVELLPGIIEVSFDNSLSLTRETSEKYEKFRVAVNNNIYELVSIANSILNWEARYGDAETTIYMNYYHNLKVEKKKQSDGTTIYILADRDTRDKFQFATRSVAWPPGYIG